MLKAIPIASLIFPIFLFAGGPVTANKSAASPARQAQEVASNNPEIDFSKYPYSGDANDLEYLRRYVLEIARDTYGLSESAFSKPTLLNTSVLRDIVHEKNFGLSVEQRHGNPSNKSQYSSKDPTSMWRQDFRGDCGHISRMLLNLYRGFGYTATRVGCINGPFAPRLSEGAYSKSHSMNEVYLPEYDGFVLQDATFNHIVIDDADTPLSFIEARRNLLLKKQGFNLLFSKEAYPDRSPDTGQTLKEHYYGLIHLRTTVSSKGTQTFTLHRMLKNGWDAHKKDTPRAADSIQEVVTFVQSRLAQKAPASSLIKELRERYNGSSFQFFDFETRKHLGTYSMVPIKGAEFIFIRVEDGVYLPYSYDIAMDKIQEGKMEPELLKEHGAILLSPFNAAGFQGKVMPWYPDTELFTRPKSD